jgi:Phage tail sheath protein subtilisin-like domain/Phage tail sheath C-terminal domain
MAETFALDSLVIPGPYVQVRAEALIAGAAVSTGNIGIVGSAAEDPDRTEILSGYDDALDAFGAYDAFGDGAGTLHLTRAAEIAYRNGAGVMFARRVAADAGQDVYTAAFAELLKDDVNILVAPQLPTADALAVLGSVVEQAENDNKDVIAVIGSDEPDAAGIAGEAPDNDRIVFVAPGIQTFDAAAKDLVTLPGTYTAAAVAGLLSTLVPQASPTNKVLPGVVSLAQRFSYGEQKTLVQGRVCVLEQRAGVRVVRGLTSDSGAFRQITTRRITDYAKAGMRNVSRPFIGKLNNERVRKALNGAINGFLSAMVADEALISYDLSVTATRADEIAGRAIVNAILRPTFSIDFVAVTLTLE